MRKVVVADVADALESTVAALQKEFSDAQVLAVKCDVSKENEVKNMVAVTVDRFGRIDYAVNCAGVAFGAPWEEFETEIWDKTIGVNERGVFLCMREEIKVMAAQDYGP